ncbi:O-antigen polysaccharide polymerase Wzy [uncultured Phascolarctobacterium sp.]|uniref:O-antigen polysaccharide polymerase Wzy n=1 Tax=uncultured Phascolarctobacterium sp. TaxID=512296 RepID=UPI0025F4E5BA|nr:O-antigen polysaccharide polymerase Wzy [uncultured Phascolarctobacterium sp.]
MKVKVNKQIIISALVHFVLVLLYLIDSIIDENTLLQDTQFVSMISVAVLAYIYISWNKLYYRFFSPYIVIVSTLYLTLCGQGLAWAFGLKAGYRDLRYATYNTLSFSEPDLCKAMLFSLLCISILHLTVIYSINKKTGYTFAQKNLFMNNDWRDLKEREQYKAMILVGAFFILLGIIPYISSNLTSYALIKAGGYGNQYESISFGIDSISAKMADFYVVGALTYLFIWGKKNTLNKNNFLLKAGLAYFFIAVHLCIQLLLGQRTGLILFCVALLFIYYNNKRISYKKSILGIVSVFILFGGLRAVDLFRSGQIQEVEKIFEYFIIDSPVFDFLGDIGWNLMSTLEFQKIIPEVADFGYGFSYLISMTSIVPNLNFWDVHPAYLYGNISGWLQNYLGFSFGIGCTPVAEAYYNFGFFGWLIFIIWGKFVVKLNRSFENNESLLDSYQTVLFMGILLKAAVRSSFFAVFRPYLLEIILPVLMIKFLSSRFMK